MTLGTSSSSATAAHNVSPITAPADPAAVNNGIAVGRLVEVASRTWPGINKLGGVARVTAVRKAPSNDKYPDKEEDRPIISVDVNYILGSSKEKNIPIEYVSLAPQYEAAQSGTIPTKSLRDRNMLLGRCLRCGSLRTDCGSCDWVTEEHQQELKIQNSNKQPQPDSPSKLVKSKKSRRSIESEGSSSSSDGTDDEEILLQQLLKQNKIRRRKHLRKHAKWKKFKDKVGLSNGRITENSSNNTQFMSSSSDENDEEDDIEEFMEQNHRRYRKYLRNKSRKETTLYSQSSLSLPLTAPTVHANFAYPQFSVLELATRTHNSANKQTGQKAKRLSSKSKANRNIFKESESQKETGTFRPDTLRDRNLGENNLETEDVELQPHTLEPAGVPIKDVSPVGIAESSPESVIDADVESPYHANEEHNDSDDSAASSLDSFTPNYFEIDRSEDLEHTIALSQFIQPEGQDVAENLPKDIIDLTKSLPYFQLPDFFDRMATQIENEFLPDYKLRCAELQRELRSIQNPRTLREESSAKMQALYDKCRQCWVELRQRVIRNGTDQCRAALRRLLDDKLYRQERKNLSTSQRKLCRGNGILDVRSLRMDALDDASESLVRKLRDIVDVCEDDLMKAQPETVESDGSDDGSSMDESTQYETQDLIPMQNQFNSTVEPANLDPCERPLPPFDPHMYGTRKKIKTNERKVKRRRQLTPSQAISKRQRTYRGRRLTETLNNFDFENRRNYDASSVPKTKRSTGQRALLSTKNSTTQHQQSQIMGKQKQEGYPNFLSRRHSKDSAIGEDKIEATENDSPSPENNSNEVPTFNLFDSEFKITAASSSKQRNRSHNQRLRFTSKLHSGEMDRSHPRHCRPISQRMQSFLDANSDNKIENWAEKGTESNNRERIKPVNQLNSRRNTDVVNPPGIEGDRRRSGDSIERTEQEAPDALEQHINGDESNTILPRTSDAPIDVRTLFDQLNNTHAVRSTKRGNALQGRLDLARISVQLQQSYARPSQNNMAIFDQIHTEVEEGLLSGSTLLPKVVDVLRTSGKCTLQELISLNSPGIQAHTRLLAECVILLKRQTPGQVFTESHGLVVETLVFKRQCFYDWMVLQLVEAVYAIMIPGAWGLTGNLSPILKFLTPLRDALAEVVPLTEKVCACVLGVLGCQQWHLGLTEGHAFVSSINPREWDSFWVSGDGPSKPESTLWCCVDCAVQFYSQVILVTRFEKLGKILPKVEVDALWGLLAYFGCSHSSAIEIPLLRWQLISKIFSCGVLAEELPVSKAPSDRLPPSQTQLSECTKQIGFFTDLLVHGTLDTVPSSDSVVLNLVRRCLELQGDEYLGNGEARAKCYPLLLDVKAVKKTIRRLWKSTHPTFFTEINVIGGRNCDSLGIPVDVDVGERDYPRLKHILVPTSYILKGGLALICAWIQRVPTKKARQNRLIKSLFAIRASLIEQAEASEKLAANISREKKNSFETAFEFSSPTVAGNGSERKSLLFREAAAYIFFMEKVSIKGTDSTCTPVSYEATNELWGVVADSAMISRCKNFLEECTILERFDGDPVRLFISAKIMACAALAIVGVSPWNLSVGNKATRMPLSGYGQPLDSRSLHFTLSCILSCLDCLCDIPGGSSHIMGHIYTIITVLFNHFSALTISDKLCMEQIKDFSRLHFPPVFEKCFKIHIISDGEYRDSLSLRLLYCTIRGVNSFLATDSFTSAPDVGVVGHITSQRNETNQVGETPVSDEEDIWGSIDDSVFENIDLTGQKMPSGTKTKDAQESLWNCLTFALDSAKPSERFAINSSQSSEPNVRMSMQGTHMISQDIHSVCDCLVSIVISSSRVHSVENMLKQIMFYIQVIQDDSDDGQFKVRIAQYMAEEVCLLSQKFEVFRTFLLRHAEPILFNYIGRLLDAKRLEHLPSCNIKKIREYSGDKCATQAFRILETLNGNVYNDPNDDSHPSASEHTNRIKEKIELQITTTWQFGRNLGSALKKAADENSCTTQERKAISDVLLNQVESEGSSLPHISLEYEALKCLRFLRGLISAILNEGEMNSTTFEKTSSFIVGTVIKHILRIEQSLKYHDQTCGLGGTTNETDITRAKILELLATYTELFFALTSWVLRESCHSGSVMWTAFLNKVYDGVLSPILRRQKLNLAVSLRDVMVLSQEVSNSGDRTTLISPSSLGCSEYLQDFFTSVVRRSRQLVFARFRNISLQNCLLEASIRSSQEDENEVARILGTSFARVVPSYPSTLSNLGPLQEEIDELYRIEENKISMQFQNKQLITSARLGFLSTFVSPFLCQKKRPTEEKRKLLRVLVHIFSAAKNQSMMYFTPSDIHSLCLCARGIAFSLVQSFAEAVVDADLISVVYSCAANLVNVGLFLDDADRQDTMLRWCNASIGPAIKGTTDAISGFVLRAVYLLTFFKWLQMLGYYMITTASEGTEKIERFRYQCVQGSGSRSSDLISFSVHSLLRDDRGFEEWNDLLPQLEKMLFPSSVEPNSNIVNVYAKKDKASNVSIESMKPWVPSASVKRATKEYIAEVVAES